MPRALGFSFDLKRIIASGSYIVRIRDRSKRAELRSKCCSAWAATKRISRHGTAGRWRPNVQVQTVDQNVMAARTSVSHGQHDTAGQLMFNTKIELLNSALLKVEILGLNSSRKICRIWLRGEGW